MDSNSIVRKDVWVRIPPAAHTHTDTSTRLGPGPADLLRRRGRLVGGLAGLLHGVDALLDGQQRRGAEGLDGPARGRGEGEGGGADVVGELADGEDVVVAEREVAGFDTAAKLLDGGADRIDAVLGLLHHRGPRL